MQKKSGKFISIEGGEGVGKSLFIQNLSNYLESQSIESISTYEPGGTPIADRVRQLFKNPPEGDKISPIAELFLVSAARAHHVLRRIKPALAENIWVLSDRFHDSTRVYQGYIGGMDDAKVELLIKESVEGCEPDITFLLNCDVDLALSRINKRGAEADRFDDQDKSFHLKLQEGYLQLAQRFPERFVVLDAAQSPDNVLKEAIQHIQNRGMLT